jgi:hypothetical protein
MLGASALCRTQRPPHCASHGWNKTVGCDDSHSSGPQCCQLLVKVTQGPRGPGLRSAACAVLLTTQRLAPPTPPARPHGGAQQAGAAFNAAMRWCKREARATAQALGTTVCSSSSRRLVCATCAEHAAAAAGQGLELIRPDLTCASLLLLQLHGNRLESSPTVSQTMS